MPRQNYSGNAVATALTADISAGAASATIVDATGWPTADFTITIGRDTAAEEKVLVTSRSGTTLTFGTRGYDSTTAQAHSSGAVAEHTISATKLDDLDDHVYDTARDDHTQYLNGARHDARDHSAALGTAVIADLADVGATAPTTGQGLVWDGSAWSPASTTGGIIAYKRYSVGGGTVATTGTTVITDVDATNLAVAFTVPSSGAVMVELFGVCLVTDPLTYYEWGIREASTSIFFEMMVEGASASPVDTPVRMSLAVPVTGLTPGASKTYKWAHRRTGGAAEAAMHTDRGITMKIVALP